MLDILLKCAFGFTDYSGVKPRVYVARALSISEKARSGQLTRTATVRKADYSATCLEIICR
jgi:hypothetical protein